jgi:hypothetical protein
MHGTKRIFYSIFKHVDRLDASDKTRKLTTYDGNIFPAKQKSFESTGKMFPSYNFDFGQIVPEYHHPARCVARNRLKASLTLVKLSKNGELPVSQLGSLF